MRELCDLAEVMLLEQMERQTLADRQALLGRGVTEGLPSWHEERALVLERLSAEPRTRAAVSGLAPEEYELRRALRLVS